MKPSQLSNTLRRIAAKIDASKKPSKVLVARELRRVVATITSKSVNVDVKVYDNTYVTTDELIDDILNSNIKGPVWFSSYELGWIAVDTDPATLTPETPINGAPFNQKTWGELTAGEYLSELEFSPYPSLKSILETNDSILWWLSGGNEEDRASLIKSLQDHGFNDIAEKVASPEWWE